MLIFMQETAKQLINEFNKFEANNEDFELKETLGKYSMDTIASCAFGVDSQSFTNQDSLFVKHASALFTSTIKDMMKIVAVMLPFGSKICKLFKIPISKTEEVEFFYNAITASLKNRKESKTRRNDLVDLMVDAVSGDIEKSKENDEDQFEKVYSVSFIYNSFSGGFVWKHLEILKLNKKIKA